MAPECWVFNLSSSFRGADPSFSLFLSPPFFCPYLCAIAHSSSPPPWQLWWRDNAHSFLFISQALKTGLALYRYGTEKSICHWPQRCSLPLARYARFGLAGRLRRLFHDEVWGIYLASPLSKRLRHLYLSLTLSLSISLSPSFFLLSVPLSLGTLISHTSHKSLWLYRQRQRRPSGCPFLSLLLLASFVVAPSDEIPPQRSAEFSGECYRC